MITLPTGDSTRAAEPRGEPPSWARREPTREGMETLPGFPRTIWRAQRLRSGFPCERRTTIGHRTVTLTNGEDFVADLVVVGIGVRPVTDLAEAAGIAVDRGILVNQQLETNLPGIFAAGDVARFPDPVSGERIRIEHWVVAQRQGALAAQNMLGAKRRLAVVPFFWSQHYVALRIVGHAARWDEVRVDGDLDRLDARIEYRAAGQCLAVATINRDRESLEAELAFERQWTEENSA